MKHVLVVRYSQSGQLSEVVESLVSPLRSTQEVKVHEVVLKPRVAYPFPWPVGKFFDVFPETVQLRPPAIEPVHTDHPGPFDLVILAYQVWFLSPSPLITAFLQSAEGKRLLAGRPVVTVIACRNMWLMAQETVKRLLDKAGAQLRDNVVLTDRANTFATLITTLRWMFTGRRESFLGLPKAGIGAEDVQGAARFGRALKVALSANKEKAGGPMLAGLGAATVNPGLILSERVAYKGFKFWSGIICRFGKYGQWLRRVLLCLFIVYLLLVIMTVLPISLVLRRLLNPFIRTRLYELQRYYEQPSGSQLNIESEG
ncbi:2-hexyl, 5-propylresorcinol biosynthesis aromatase DarA [Pseudomonas chlororaphis]|uniref:2-hexyl, 5-propylresorcinol biosynthesis aromatase DarA n=1 Tax=Pseudomonas chlororaphis TaxID=587753 RepID=UPI0003D2A2F9|nr:2-hexyl, 5-propylresorcinol biosynthesis aromatase DarA [Pseudomonas chlororaphis]AZD30772.1 Dialkylrecorsinol condensing enzyme [Pseudomonas chlororaphis]ETD34906.1 dialkylrecorsinol condensing enzyme [Pseudomonas chlororaphis subsp. aurantiaca PB-St2]QFS56128.1 2-hexyl, 5-propylresorcinol biosynthesis aromatase DarA [Pseudomonas chlororaphis subsp. aurantiaca]